MADKVIVSRDKLVAVADAVREKTGNTESLTLDEMPGAIAGIDGGGEGDGLVIDFSKNLNVAEEIVADFYLKQGEETAYKGWSTTGFIKPTQGTYCAVKSPYTIRGLYSAFYDENKLFKAVISGDLAMTSYSNSFLLFECKSEYVRFSAETKAINALKIYECSGGV